AGTDGKWDAAETVPDSQGWRLPTEAQWEYAARAGTVTAFSNGAANWKDEASIKDIGWFTFNSGEMTHEVGLKQPNPWGLHDMHGNVLEWCWDWYNDKYPSQAQTDPAGASSGSFRVFRGGCWNDSAQDSRSAFRGGYFPRIGQVMGLRLLCP
ncbi:MAG: formylglycine-generating enzyme family protein, partial [Spirochaetes bacterium]|nr:formylglycine-generating enzyme family protein [Spirochaetota bacterium]